MARALQSVPSTSNIVHAEEWGSILSELPSEPLLRPEYPRCPVGTRTREVQPRVTSIAAVDIEVAAPDEIGLRAHIGHVFRHTPSVNRVNKTVLVDILFHFLPSTGGSLVRTC